MSLFLYEEVLRGEENRETQGVEGEEIEDNDREQCQGRKRWTVRHQLNEIFGAVDSDKVGLFLRDRENGLSFRVNQVSDTDPRSLPRT